mgnify:CR=1 FL=1
MKTITFYSYKGGVGRSLTLSNIAMRLADLGKKVCIIDFDLEAPGLHLKFNKHINQSEINKGIVEYISDFQNKDYVPKSINEYVTDVNYLGTLNGSIKLIPAGDIYSNEYWKNLSSINWKDLFYSEENNGVNLLLHLKELIKIDLNPDFILIDSRTGITDISGIAMTLLADSVVTLAANNDENISGTARIIKSLMNNENNLLGSLPKIHFVLTRIPYYQNPEDKHREIRLTNKALAAINKDEKLIENTLVSPKETTEYTAKSTINGCLKVIAKIQVKVEKPSIEDINNSVVIYPNPTNDYVTISSNSQEIKSIQINNMVGGNLKTFKIGNNLKQQTLNISDLITGVYVVIIEVEGNNTITKKLIKN